MLDESPAISGELAVADIPSVPERLCNFAGCGLGV